MLGPNKLVFDDWVVDVANVDVDIAMNDVVRRTEIAICSGWRHFFGRSKLTGMMSIWTGQVYLYWFLLI